MEENCEVVEEGELKDRGKESGQSRLVEPHDRQILKKKKREGTNQ